MKQDQQIPTRKAVGGLNSNQRVKKPNDSGGNDHGS